MLWTMRIATLVLCLAAAACGAPPQTGLSNAPGGTRAWTPEDRSHDAIANGPGSCPPPGSELDDPLPNRWPKCPEHPTAAPAPSARPATQTPVKR